MGVGVYFEKERINSLSAQSEVMMSVLSAIAQSESENLSQNIRWGIQKRFQDGSYILSSAPYGYGKTADGELALDSEQAPIVRRIFEAYLNGYGVYAIAKMLIAEGIPTSRGAEKWNDGVVKEILQNPVYYGELRLQKTYTTQGFPFARKRNHGEVQQYSVVENHPAIVSVEEFQQVHEIAKYRREQSKFDGTSFLKRYPFSGKLVCDQCGSTFRRQKLSIGKPYESVQWCCKTHIIDKEKCPRKAVKECVIENAFQSMWNKLVCNQYEILEPLLVGLKEYQRGQVAEQIEELDHKIDEVIERSRILSRVLDKGYVDSALFMSQQTELNVQLEEYKKQRNMLLKSCDLAKEIDGTLHIIEIIKHNPKPIFTYQASIFEAVVTKVVMGESSITFQLINGLNLREEW